MIVLIVMVIGYILLSPLIFFIINKNSISSLQSKINDLEKEVSVLKSNKRSNEQSEVHSENAKVYSEELSPDDNTYQQYTKPVVNADLIKEDDKSSEPSRPSVKERIKMKDKKKKARAKVKLSVIEKAKDNINAESIIGKLGALLLLVGIGFVYKFAYDNGYIGQKETIILGYIVSIAMLSSGIYFIKKGRVILSQILIGTAFASSYITTYAGHLYYGIIDNLDAFLILTFISLFVFGISYVYNFYTVVVMANIMSITVPFLVDMEFLGITGFGLYLISLSLISMIMYYLKRWNILQITNIVTSFGALFFISSTNSEMIDLKLLSYLVIVQSLVVLLPDIFIYVYNKDKAFYDNKKVNIKGAVVQVVVFASTFILVSIIGELSKNTISYIMIGYAIMYGMATYFTLKNTDFAIFIKFLYLLCTVSIVIATSVLFIDLRLGLFIMAVSILLVVFDKYVKSKLTLYVAAFVYFGSLIITISDFLDYWDDESIKSVSIILLVSILIMVIIDRYLRKQYKALFRFLSYQIYLSVFIDAAIVVLNSNMALDDIVDFNLIFPQILVANTVLFAVYELIRYKYNIFNEKKSLITMIVLNGFNILALAVFNLDKLNMFMYDDEFVNHLTWIHLLISVVVIVAIVLLAKKSQDKSKNYLYKIAILTALGAFSLIQVSVYLKDIRYGILLLNIVVFAFEIYSKKYSKEENKAKDLIIVKVCKLFSVLTNLVFFIYIYPDYYMEEKINLLSLLINSINMKLLFENLKIVKINKYASYIISAIMIIYLSYVHIYIPTEGNHYVSLVWASYVIITFVYYLRKADIKMANICIASLVIIVVKFVVIDLSGATLISKVITSIAFGLALLGLSYLMPKLAGNYSEKVVE